MKKCSIISLFIFLESLSICAQVPNTVIYVADLEFNREHVQLRNFEKIKVAPGYNNQPEFGPSGRIYFTAIADEKQADVYYYDESNKKNVQVTYSNESEYSPTPYGNNQLSFVSVDMDSAQRFYDLNLLTHKKTLLMPDEDSIGYFQWLNEHTIVYFCLGNPVTLKLYNSIDNSMNVIDTSVGRCFGTHPIHRQLTYTLKRNNEVFIMMYNSENGKSSWVCKALEGSEDYAWLNDGSLLMGSNGSLYRLNPMLDNAWKKVASLENEVGNFYRIKVNALGNRIALVAYEGEKP
ncbi:MAG TPA: hypothetical protein PKM16_06470 [Bacteroidia bacterium]|nr:hypothetical protein [Bacteroidia bacterium]